MECLITSDQSSDNTSLNFWNPSSGTKLLSLRGPSAHPSSLCNINDEGFAVVEVGKPFIHFWQSGQPLQSSRRILCPGKPCAAAVTPDGSYFAVAIDEKISIWQAASGRIVATVTSAHFRPVTVLKFNSNGTHLISGGQDGLVHCWNFLQLVSNTLSSPTYSWSDHSLSITGIHVGAGGQKATIYTSSLDRTCKMYSLITGTLLLSISFPIALTAVVVDSAGYSVYLGTKSGLIYQTKLQSPPRSIEQHILSDAAADSLFKNKHTNEVTALAMSADGKTLVSGDTEGNIFMWDVPSKQSVRTIQQQPPSSVINTTDASNKNTTNCKKVTNISFWLGNPENLKGAKKPMVPFPDVPKLLDAQEENENPTVRIWTRNKQDDNGGMTTNRNVESSLKLAELSKLRMELAKNQLINKRLHEFCAANILDMPTEKRASKEVETKKVNKEVETKKVDKGSVEKKVNKGKKRKIIGKN